MRSTASPSSASPGPTGDRGGFSRPVKGIGTGNIVPPAAGFSALRGIEQGTGSKFALSGTTNTDGEIAGAWRGGACGSSLPLGSPYRAFDGFPLSLHLGAFSRPVKLLGGKWARLSVRTPEGLGLEHFSDGSRGERENGDGGHRDNCTLVGLSANLRDYLGVASHVFVVQKRFAGHAPHP